MISGLINCVIRLVRGWLQWLTQIFLLSVFITRTRTIGRWTCVLSLVITLPPWLMTRKPYSPGHLCIVLFEVEGFTVWLFWCDFTVWLCCYCCFCSVLTCISARLHWLVRRHYSVLIFSCSSASTLDMLCYFMETRLSGRIFNFSVCVVSAGCFGELWWLFLILVSLNHSFSNFHWACSLLH